MGKRKSSKKEKSDDNVIAVVTSTAIVAMPRRLAFSSRPIKTLPSNSNTVFISAFETLRIYLIRGFMLPYECKYFIEYGEERGFVECEQKQTKEFALRNNGRIQIDDPILADGIYERLQPALPKMVDGMHPAGCSSNIRLYRYTAGQSFGRHIDEAHDDERLRGVTKFTLLIYLNGQADEDGAEGDTRKADNTAHNNEFSETKRCDHFLNEDGTPQGDTELRGGETVFYGGRGDNQALLSVTPECGMLLLHGHGARCLTHEGRLVTQGVKYVLRTDVVYR